MDSVVLREIPCMRLFPNPAKNKGEIELKGFEPGYIQVQLLDNNGKLRREDKRFVLRARRSSYSCFQKSRPVLYMAETRCKKTKE